jgi:hypothetical protein
MNQKDILRMFGAIALAALCFSTASAQTSANKQDKKRMTVQKAQPVPLANRTPLQTEKKSVAPANTARKNSVSTSNNQTQHAASKEQLMLQRKQAAAKGLPTAEYDNAIKQLNTNQAQ